jgi:hypothetical protein
VHSASLWTPRRPVESSCATASYQERTSRARIARGDQREARGHRQRSRRSADGYHPILNWLAEHAQDRKTGQNLATPFRTRGRASHSHICAINRLQSMARRGAQPITAADLETASKAFRYETRVLRHMAARLPRVSVAVQLNAYIESFLIHARAVDKFLHGQRQRSRDATAADFFSDPQPWINARRPAPTAKLDIVDRIGREIAHITFARSWNSPTEKQWNIPGILAELDKLEDVFFDLGPEGWVGPRAEPTGTAITVSTPMANSSGVTFDPIVYGPNLTATRGFFPDDPWGQVIKP